MACKFGRSANTWIEGRCSKILLNERYLQYQNCHDRVGTLYREPLGKIVVHYDNVYQIEKELR